MGDKLRRCPFCGGEAERFECQETDNRGGDVVGCIKCLASTKVFFGEKDGICESWNTRADDALIRRLGDALKATFPYCMEDEDEERVFEALTALKTWEEENAAE